jgi:DNA polymerase III epsilon subunit-like protein
VELLEAVLDLDRRLVAIDLETTSAAPSQARIVEIAVIAIDPARYERAPGDAAELLVPAKRTEWWTLVNPGVSIPAEATEKHGIKDEHVLDKPRFEALAPRLAAALTGVDFLGYNVRYDLEVLACEFERVKQPWAPGDGRAIDPLRLWQVQSPRTLSDAHQEFVGTPLEDAHSGQNDIAGTLRVLVGQLARWPQLPHTVAGLDALLNPKNPNHVDPGGRIVWRDGVAVMNIGKHNGLPLSKVPRSYLEWALGADFPLAVKAIFRDALAGKYPQRTA